MVTTTNSGVKDLRIKLGLSQSQLAERLRVSKRTVSRWESGDTAAHPVYIDKLRAMLQSVVMEDVDGANQ